MIAFSEGFLELEDLGGAPVGGISDWLLVYLWKVRLKQAFAAGVPKEYVAKQGQLPTVRGTLDVNSLLRLPADLGRYSCQWREHSFDNPMRRLVNITFSVINKRATVAELVSDAHRKRNAFAEASGGRVGRMPID